MTRTDDHSGSTGESAATSSAGAKSAGDIRTWLVAAVAGELDVPPDAIDTTAPLESFGIDSMAAFIMTGDMASWLGCELPATLLWDHPTIDALSVALAGDAGDEVDFPGVLAMRSTGGSVPIFFLPGVGGHPVSFARIAEQLPSDQPAYGLKLPGVEGDGAALSRVEDIASVVTENLRRVQPRGPYQLAGYSLGGLLAYEIAQQLTAAGESVPLLVMYDTFAPGARVRRRWWQRFRIHLRQLTWGPDRGAHLRDRLQRIRERFGPRRTTAEPATDANGAASVFAAVRQASRLAAERYRPAPYPGRIVVFQASEPEPHYMFMRLDPTHGWGALASGGVEVIPLPGRHLTVFDADLSTVVAEALRPLLLGSTSRTATDHQSNAARV